MEYRDEIRDQVLDGKRSWNKNSDAGGDADVFYTRVVVPLRELRDEGFFEKLYEHIGNARGRRNIDRVDIGGSINLDY